MKKRLPLILSALCVVLSSYVYGQSDNCDASSMTLAAGVNSGDNTGSTPDEDYNTEFVCTSADFDMQVWYQFTATSSSAEMTFTSTGINNASIFIVAGCGPCAGPDHIVFYICDVANGATEMAGICLDPGTTYWIGISSAAGDEGTFDLEIDESASFDGLNTTCSNPMTITSGITVVNNYCSSTEFLFFEYVVQTGPAISISTSNASPIVPVCSGSSQQVHFPDCTNATSNPPFGTVPIDECLAVGQTVIIRVDAALDHTIEIEITDPDPGGTPSEPHDFCSTALDHGVLSCSASISEVGNGAACPDDDGCNNSDPGIWGTFTVDPSVPYFDISGSGFELFSGPDCMNLTSISCDNIMQVSPADPTTTYFYLITGNSSNSIQILPPSNPAPTNDACNTSNPVLTASNPGLTNLCATADINVGSCGATVSEATVWYQYTPTQNIVSLDITLVANTIVSPAFALYDACGGALLDESCGAGTITLECLNTDPIWIQVGSEAILAGDFDLNITEGNPVNPNDLCTDAATDPENTLIACTPATITGDNTDSCPEAVASGGCNQDTEPTVWEELTIPAGTVSLDFTNISAGFNITVWQNCTGSFFTPDCITGAGSVALPAGTTSVFVSVSSAVGSEGAYSFDVLPIVPPTNDSCLFPDPTTGSPLTNACATADLVSGCPVAEDEATVWYSYNIANPITSITIDLTVIDIANQAISVFAGTCTTLDLLGQACSGATQVVVDCPPVGDILIMIGSAFADTGEFTLNVTEGPPAATNDLCDMAVDAGTLQDCIAETIMGSTVDGCPEDILVSGCSIDTDPTTWYQYTLPAGATAMEISNINLITATDVNLTVWTDCPPTTFLAPACFNTDQTFNGVTGGTTYYISATSAGVGTFSFDVLAIVPPANDLCNVATNIALSTGTSGTLTNVCATADVAFNGCAATQEESTVWYSYTVVNPVDEITITLAGTGTAITNPAFMVLDADAGCNGVPLDELCAAGALTIDCPPSEIFILVGSAFDEAGEFTLDISLGNPTPGNDLCANATAEPALVACVPNAISGTNAFACPEDFTLTGCNIDIDPTVWHEITLPAGSTDLEVNVTSGSISITLWDTCPLAGNAFPPVCINGADIIDLQGTGGGTYYVSVSSTDGNEGPYSFDLTPVVPPANDDCAMAEVINAGTTLGTNICSTDDADPNCTISTDVINTVWYSYTVPAGVKSVTINVAGTGTPAISGIHVQVLDACPPGGALYQTGPDSETCTGDDIILTCPNPGDVVFILVGSTDPNEGDFNITITEDNPTCTYGNDECANAEPLPVDPITNDVEQCISGCNELACPDPEIDGVCGVTTNNVVWFTVTTDGFDPTIETFITAEISNEVDFNPVVGIFAGSCPPLSGLTAIGCNPGSNVTVSNTANPAAHPMPNTTYYIAVANSDDTQTGGTFDLCVEVVQGCANDECVSALTINDGVTQVTTTNGCTEDITVQACGLPMGPYESSAWYNYTVPAGVTAILVETSGATGDLVFDFMANIDCSDPNPFGNPSMTVDCPFDGEELITCVEEGDVYTFFFASDINGVDFDLTITGLPPDDPLNPSPTNDLCDDPIIVMLNDMCEFVPVVVDNLNACPETFTLNPCTFDMDPTVWYEVTLPPDATGLQFDNISNNTYLSVFDDNCPFAPGDPALACMDQNSLAPIVGLTGGSTYLIAVGNAVESSSHGFEVLAITQPENDEPCPMDPDFPPADLTGGVSYSGTTCCALGSEDLDASGNPLDYANIQCTATATQENVVWFIYQWSDDGSDGFEINFSPTGIQGNASMEVYCTTDINGGCSEPIPATAEDIVGWNCDATSGDPIRVGCPDPDKYYYIKLSTADATCGEYTISVDPAFSECSVFADDCEDAPMLITQTPDGCEDGEIPLEAPGCLDMACPEDVYTDCGQNLGPTVWFQINIDDTDANGLYTQVDAPGFDAIWAIYEGTSCDDMSLVSDLDEDNPPAAFPCSFSDGDPNNLFTVPIGTDPATGDDFTYWVSVTAVGPITDPNFVLNYGATLGCIACSGNDAQDCDNGDFEAFVDGELSPGPFCAGSEVEICLEFNYNTTGTGNDWLHGIIPSFGPGWDTDAIDFPSIDLGNPNWVWAEAGGACAPYLNGYSLPNACTYTNDEGLLQICNVSCNPSCDCDLGAPLPDGSPLPSGWFWSSSGSSPTCAGACTPSDNWGVPSGTNVDVDICMTLKVKAFDTPEECEQNKDLKIFFQTTSDAISGCWVDSSPCIIDPSFESPAWEIDCDSSPPAQADPMLICSGDMANVFVDIEGGNDGEIEIEISDDTSPDIIGQTETVFTGGSGIITDELINCGTTVDTARYIAFAIVDGFQCPGVPVEIKVPVLPKIVIDPQPNPYISCLPHTIENLPANISGGSGIYTTVEWYWNGTGAPIGIGPILTSYTLNMDGFIEIQVTDSEGCMETHILEIDVFEKLEPEIEIDDTEVCKDVNFLGASASVQLGQVDDWFWYSEDVNGNPINIFTGGNTGSNVNIDPSDPTLDPGKYTIFVEASNDVGCVGIDSICLTIYPLPNGVIVQQPSANCDAEVELCIEFYDASGNDVYGNGPDLNANGIPDLFEDANGNADFTSITWYASFIPGGSNTNDLCFLTSTQSWYDAEIETANGCFGLVQIDEIVLPSSTPPMIEADTICIGEMTTLAVMPQNYDTYMWEDADGNPIGGGSAGPMINVGPMVSSTYFLTVTDANNCTGETSVTVEVNPLPDPQFSGNLSICAGQETEITALGDPSLFDFNWLDGAGTSISMDSFVVISTTGTYTLEVTNEFGCLNDTMFTVITAASLDINISGADICDDDGCTTLNGGAGFDNYIWTDLAGTVIASGPMEQILEVCDPGDYILEAEQGVCSGRDTITINQVETPTIDIVDGEACNITTGGALWYVDFESLVLSSAGGTWSSLTDQTIGLSPLDSVSFAGLPQGNYEFVYTTNTAVLPCADISDTITIVVGPCDCPNPNVNDPIDLCNGDDNYNLNSLLSTNTDPGQWVFLMGPDATVLDGDTMFVYNGVTPGVYEFAYELVPVPIGTCTELADTIAITVEEPPVADIEMFACACQTPSTTGQGCNNGSTMLNLDDYVNSGSGVWLDPGIAGLAWTPPMLDFENLPLGQLVLTFQTDNAIAPCNNVEYTLTVDVIDCACPNVTVFPVPDQCNADNPMIDLTQYEDPNISPGTWVESATNPTSGNISGTIVTFDDMDDAGLYIFTYVLTNPVAGCPAESDPVIISVSAPPSVTVMDAFPCNVAMGMDSTTIELNSLVSDPSIGVWTDPTGLPLTNTFLDFDGETVGTVFTYTFTTNTAVAPCTDPEYTVTITVADCACPPLSFANPPLLCSEPDGSVDLDDLVLAPTPPGTWSLITSPSGSTATLVGSNLNATGSVAGVYTVEYQPDGELPICAETLDVTVSVPATASLTSGQIICTTNTNGEITNFDLNDAVAPGGEGGTWTDQDGMVITDTDIEFLGQDDGTYMFTYTLDSPAPCDPFIGSIEITAGNCACPIVFDLDTYCSTGGTIELFDIFNISFPGTWYFNDGTPVPNSIIDYTNFADGLQTVYFEMDDPGATCLEQYPVNFNIVSPADLGEPAEPLRICEGENVVVNLLDLLPDAPAGGTWVETSVDGSTPGAFDDASGSFTTGNESAANYSFQYEFQSLQPCDPVAETVQVIIEGLPTAEAGQTQTLTCDDNTAELGDDAITSQGINFSYQWTETGGATIPNDTESSIVVSESGVYTLVVTDTNTGCSTEDIVTVNADGDIPSVSANIIDISCFGAGDGSIDIFVSGGKEPIRYSIDGGANYGTSSQFSNLGPGSYQLSIIDDNGCETGINVEIIQPEQLTVDLGGDITLTETITDTILTFNSNYPIDQITNVVWTDEDGVILCEGTYDECREWMVGVTVATVYCVELTTANGCVATDCVQIRAIIVEDCYVPNIFSPNDDAQNDVFFMQCDEYATSVNKFFVFDRWGELVYGIEGVLPNDPSVGWDGTLNDKPVEQGVYAYYIEVEFNEDPDNIEIYAGDITVIR